MGVGKKRTVSFDKLERELNITLAKIPASVQAAKQKIISLFPFQVESAAVKFYPSVLNVRTGHLKQSIAGFFRRLNADQILLGLQNKMEYAEFLEYGTKKIRIRRFLGKPLLAEGRQLNKQLKRLIGFSKAA